MMESKFEFEELPFDLKYKITREFTTKDILHFADTLRSKKVYYGFFKPEILDVRKLLHYMVRGDHNRVQQILKENIHLMFKMDKVTDCSGREFENVSSFEYALWALDKHMWTMMISCIPQSKEGRELFAQLLAQYNNVNTKGVTYQFNGKTITEKHFDFENTIIKAAHLTQVYSPVL